MWASDPSAPPTKVSPEAVPPWGPGWPLCPEARCPMGHCPLPPGGHRAGADSSLQDGREGLRCQVFPVIHESGLWPASSAPGTS